MSARLCLVLGDCGLAIKLESEDRLSTTYENVGSRDWMPGWAHGMRVEDVKPNFDVFSLGKLLWSMVSGRPKLRLWYFDRPEFDLRSIFPDSDHVFYVNRILEMAVVEEPTDCLPDAGSMLLQVDKVIAALESGSQLPSEKKPMRCRFCGIGNYEVMTQFQNDSFFNPGDRRVWYRCTECAHLESFFLNRGIRPDLWQ